MVESGTQVAIHLREDAVVGCREDATDSGDRIAGSVTESRQPVRGTSSEAGLDSFELGVEVDGSEALVELAITFAATRARTASPMTRSRASMTRWM